MKKKTNGVDCGDWHLGWGYGGCDKIGRLTLNEDETFTWAGKSQGRHGRSWGYGSHTTFKLTEAFNQDPHLYPGDKIEYVGKSKGSLPDWRDVLEAINTLLAPEPLERVRVIKTKVTPAPLPELQFN